MLNESSHVAAQLAVKVLTMTPGRIGASVGALIALIAAIIGGRALARSRGHSGTGTALRGGLTALVLGPLGMAIGGLVVITADGGIGTGGGLAGGVVAIMVGLIGVALGGLAVMRTRRAN